MDLVQIGKFIAALRKEQNLTQPLKTSSFSLKKKIEFYKNKWLKEHIAIMLFAGICITGVMLTGILSKQILLIYIGGIMLLIAHGWRNNAMMAYVEKYAFDGTGDYKERI